MPNENSDIIRIGEYEFAHARIEAPLMLASIGSMPQEVAERNRAVAEQLYWQTDNNPDLVWVQFILDSEGVNGNWDYNPRSNILANYATAKYKPMDMNHVIKEEKSLVYADVKNPPAKNTIFGVMTNAALANANGEILTDKQIEKLDKTDDPFRPVDDRITVVAWAALYNFLFPQTVAQLVNAIKAGAMKVSMERWIRKWDFIVTDGADSMEVVSRADAEKNGTFDNWKTRRSIAGKQTWRRSVDAIYGGVASTDNPANSMSRFLSQSEITKAAATLVENDVVFEKLLNRHSELHQLFDVTSDEKARVGIIAEHERVTAAIAAYLGPQGKQ